MKKKLLTVLLSLAVVFTYSVPAFAAQTTDEKTAAVNADLKLATEVLNSYAANYQAAQKVAGTYTDEAIVYAVDATKNLGLLFINNYSAQEAALSGDYPSGNPVTTELNNWLDSLKTATVAGTGAYSFTQAHWETAYNSYVVAKDYDAAKAAALAKVAAVDTTTYYVDLTANPVVDNATQAKNIKDAVTASIKAITASGNSLTGATGTFGYKDAINAYLYGYSNNGTILTSSSSMATQKTAEHPGLYAQLDALTTIAEKAAEDAANKENTGFTMAELNTLGKVTFYKAKRVEPITSGTTDITSNVYYNPANKTLNGVAIANPSAATPAEVTAANAALMSRIDNALAVLTVYYTENPNAAKVTDVPGFATALSNAETAMAEYDSVVKAGDALKLKLDTVTGIKKYDDAQIDKLVAAAKTDIYSTYAAGTWSKDYFASLTDVSSAVEKAISEAKAKFTSTATADAKYHANHYDSDPDVQSAVTVLLNKAKAALTDAKSVEEVNKIMSDLDTALAAYRTAEQQTTVNKAISDGNYLTALAKFADSQATLKGSDYRTVLSFTDDTDNNITSAYEAGKKLINSAKTAEEVPALFEQAKALFNNVKSDAEIKAAGQALAAKIAALPTTATLADRDSLLAAKAAYDDFKAIYGASDSDVYNLALLTTKLNTLKAAEIKSIQDQVNALPSTLTLADADKVKAIKAELDKYLAEYEIEPYTYNGTDSDFAITATTYNKLNSASDSIADLEKMSVAKQIYDLPTTVALSDADKIAAARTAYDALDKTQQGYLITNGYYAKLVKAENDLAVLQAGSVKAYKITASSKAYKGKMVIKWKKVGATVSGVKYQVWRSTSKNTGFKKMFTTSKMTYINTKNLKAGKTYYYKVRAFVTINGVTSYSDWSNKAFRTAK